MKSSEERILTTHVGSIPRPDGIKELLRRRLRGEAVDEQELARHVDYAVRDVVRRQAEIGLDVVSDGEMGRTSFIAYTDERLNGFETLSPSDPSVPASNTSGSWERRLDTRREWRNFRDYYAAYLPDAMPPSALPAICTGPVSYKGEPILRAELQRLRDALEGVGVEEAFVPAIAPGMVGRGQNKYYKTEEEYRFAIAGALKHEYKAIVDAGFILQIDDPGLGETWDMVETQPDLEQYRKLQQMHIEALNQALAGIPEDRVRYHLCWGSWQGPHLGDLRLRDVIDLMLTVRAQAYSVEAATPRHAWEWQVWEDVRLPEGKILIPGVIAHTTAVVEHPETIAERIAKFAGVVGPKNVMAGADCGFAQGALYARQHPSVMWAKFEALVAGARLASERLFS